MPVVEADEFRPETKRESQHLHAALPVIRIVREGYHANVANLALPQTRDISAPRLGCRPTCPSVLSYRRRPVSLAGWIPASAGMTLKGISDRCEGASRAGKACA